MTEAEIGGRRPLRRMRVRSVLTVALAVALAVAGLLAWIDRATPTHRIVNGGRIWKCEKLGGTTGVDMDHAMGVREGHHLDRKALVKRSDAKTLVVADIVGADGKRVGTGVWNYLASSNEGAVDDVARAYSSKHSTITMKGNRLEVRAARECSRRGLSNW